MVRLSGVFSKLQPVKIAVIGDVMLDTYTIGKVSRISPEAPVAVLNVQKEEQRAGGAGNVILNLQSLGVEVVPIARLGSDYAGGVLQQLFGEEKIALDGLFIQQGYVTPTKNRIIADGQQIVRVDREAVLPLPELLEQNVIEDLPRLLSGVQAIAISDYGKGFLSRTLLAALIEFASAKKIPVIADPKDIDFSKYSGVSILKPNVQELYNAAQMKRDVPLEHAAAAALASSQAEMLMVTRSEEGISIFYKDGRREDFPVDVQEVRDVTGAGDTVLAVVSCAIANCLPIDETVRLSNAAASIAIARFGCARVSLADLAERLLQLDFANKIFDAEHLFALKHALVDKKSTLLILKNVPGLTSCVFKTINSLGKNEGALVVHLFDEAPCEEFIDILTSLSAVDFILLPSDFLQIEQKCFFPDEIYLLDNETLSLVDNTHPVFSI